jgi:hypothetical protein
MKVSCPRPCSMRYPLASFHNVPLGQQKRVERQSTATVVRRLFRSFPARVEELWAQARPAALPRQALVALLHVSAASWAPGVEAACMAVLLVWRSFQ